MSSMGNVVSDWGAVAGDKGSTSLKGYTKSGSIQSSLDNLISQYNSYAASDSTALDSFISNYLKTAPATNAANAASTAQETGAIGGYYNGDVANTLAGFTAQQAGLGDRAVAQALQQNRGNMNRSILGGGGSGDSSWNNRYGINVASQLDLQNAMNILNQQRTDYGTVLGGEVSNAGKRMALNNALTSSNVQSATLPISLQQMLLTGNISDLTGLSGINNANNQYAYQYNPSQTELWGNLTSAGGATGSQIMSAGMGGGGGKTGGTGTGGGSGATNFAAQSAAPSYAPANAAPYAFNTNAFNYNPYAAYGGNMGF